MSCPENPALLRFISRDASVDERLRIVRHLLACGNCRDLAAMLARLLPNCALDAPTETSKD